MIDLKRLSCSLAVVVLFTVFGNGSIAATPHQEPPFASFREVPGVTQEEIAALEKLQARGGALVYGAVPSGEAFELDGEINGFTALYCRLMTEMFGIEFRLELKDWNEIHEGLNTGTVAFTGEMTASGERRAAGYLMTEAIAQRSIKLNFVPLS